MHFSSTQLSTEQWILEERQTSTKIGLCPKWGHNLFGGRGGEYTWKDIVLNSIFKCSVSDPDTKCRASLEEGTITKAELSAK